MSFGYTENQLRAIETRGSSLLVSAAAGSGKTRVLTQRLMDYVTDPDCPEDIDRFLIISFTRAAAAEMRSRIADALAEAAAADPGNRHLRRQQDKCYTAQIGTIHSFCTTVLRENCHLLGLPPGFRVLDEDSAAAMKNSAAEKLLEERYANMDKYPGFRRLTDTVGAGRDDRRLCSAMLELYEKLRSHPYPEDWAGEQMELYGSLAELEDISATPWGQELIAGILRSARYWSEKMDKAVEEIYSADDAIKAAYGEVFLNDAAVLRDFVRALEQSWDRGREFLPPESFEPLGRLMRYHDPEFKDRIKAVRDGYKKAAGHIRKQMEDPSCVQLENLAFMAEPMIALLKLTMDFDRAFSAEKRRASALDFSDLEHMCARLLVDKESGKPTWLAVELSQRYREIMVDEYQDVNAVQDMIFRALSRQDSNLFMVGDVKQSIYRFRLADPGIFLEKYRSYSDWSPGSGAPRRIMLQENFRSRKAVLDAANHVFSNIMSPELGELDYDENAALRYGAVCYGDPDSAPRLCLIDCADAVEEDSPEKSRLEARFVASQILDMMSSGTTVSEPGGQRPCRWSDFVILMRSPGGKGSIFHEELAAAGIPVLSQSAGGFFSSLEVSLTMDMLAVIDNPHSDVPLISVLRSPAFCFSADELSSIRCADRKGDFYSALQARAREGDGHCAEFLDFLSRLRMPAPDLSLDELIWRVYSQTGLFALCSAMSDAQNRRENLMRLFEMAKSFEQTGHKGLFRFSAWLRRMAEREQEPPLSSGGEAVAIMSIHKSKGLEFPFVFLCDLHHRFNKSDSQKPVLFHSELGLGPKYTNTELGIEYPTLARRAIDSRLETEGLSEEMRVLYVAMTRARERLIMTACQNNAAQWLSKQKKDLSSPLHPQLLRSAQSPMHWLCWAALCGEELIKPEIIPSADIELRCGENAPQPHKAAADGALVDFIAHNLSFRYPWQDAVEKPTKVSATELKDSRSPEDGEAAPLLTADEEPGFSMPTLGGKDPAVARHRGSAAHSFLQHVDLSRTGNMALLRQELTRLSQQGILSSEEAALVDLKYMERFFQSDTGRKICGCQKLLREFRFTILVDADDSLSAPQQEEVLLQGVVDCLLIEPDGISIIDYKTDRVTAAQAPHRALRYAMQLRAYARAAGRIFRLPVKERIVHFLSCGESIKLPND